MSRIESCRHQPMPPRLRQAFRRDLATAWQVIEVTPSLANRARLLAEKHGLRGYDAMQLAAGLRNANYSYLTVRLPPVSSSFQRIQSAMQQPWPKGLASEGIEHHP